MSNSTLPHCGMLKDAGGIEMPGGTVIATSGVVLLTISKLPEPGIRGAHRVQIMANVPVNLSPSALSNALNGIARSVRTLAKSVETGHPPVNVIVAGIDGLEDII